MSFFQSANECHGTDPLGIGPIFIIKRSPFLINLTQIFRKSANGKPFIPFFQKKIIFLFVSWNAV
jgi:hypothetical protein